MAKSKARHTPGPWKVTWDEYGKSSEVYGKKGKICEPVCIIPHDDITEDGEKEMKANANLIETAPELLKLLTVAAHEADEIEHDSYALHGHEEFDPRDWKKKALVAIAKATGSEAA